MRRTLTLVIALMAVLILNTATALGNAIPAGWNCTGACGTLGTDGVVPVAPIHTSFYEYVTTNGGISGVGKLPNGAFGNEKNGSVLSTPVFSAYKGGTVSFYFDYVTSDGMGFVDYGWAALVDASTNTMTALLATARSGPGLTPAVPGFGMPAAVAYLTPSAVAIGGGTNWSPLGPTSGMCYANGCGNTWWVYSLYTIPKSGSYTLQFGVVNINDEYWDSGMAIGGVAVGLPSGMIPELSSLWLLLTGMAGFAGPLLRKLHG